MLKSLGKSHVLLDSHAQRLVSFRHECTHYIKPKRQTAWKNS